MGAILWRMKVFHLIYSKWQNLLFLKICIIYMHNVADNRSAFFLNKVCNRIICEEGALYCEYTYSMVCVPYAPEYRL